MEIGDKIKELRKEKKLTQKELASAIGVTQGVIHFWETGRNKPSTYNLILLSRVLGRSLTNDLFKEKADLLDSFEQDMEKIKKETLEQHKAAETILDETSELYNEYKEIIDFMESNPLFMSLLKEMCGLNEIGIRKVFEYIQDLKNNPNYKNDSEQ